MWSQKNSETQNIGFYCPVWDEILDWSTKIIPKNWVLAVNWGRGNIFLFCLGRERFLEKKYKNTKMHRNTKINVFFVVVFVVIFEKKIKIRKNKKYAFFVVFSVFFVKVENDFSKNKKKHWPPSKFREYIHYILLLFKCHGFVFQTYVASDRNSWAW